MKTTLILLVLALPAFATEPGAVDSDPPWIETVRLASAEEKPILVFSRPETCAEGRHPRPCADFDALIAHPAICRRLARVAFRETAIPGDREGALELFDPSGNLLNRWTGIPNLESLSAILSLVEGATPYVLAAHRAALYEMSPEAERASALAALALGRAMRGREKLEALRTSASDENRQLADLWLEKLDASQKKRAPSESVLTAAASGGTTQRVRFEGWMALGNLRYTQNRVEDAIRSYRTALVHAPADFEDVVLSALWQIEELTSAALGLGGTFASVAGRRTIQPRSTGPDVAKVEFRLDGRLVATATKAPFTAAVGFGPTPKRQVLDIIARNRSGRVIHRENVVVNPRSDELSVHIAEPAGSTLAGPVEVEVATRVPRGRRVESVLVEWNGSTVARLTSSPYRTSFHVQPGERGILRAALRLDDGTEAEDALLANSGSMNMGTDVNLVEVPVYSDGPALKTGDLILREDGQLRSVDRIIAAADAPLRIAFALDTSKSMEKHMLDVQEATLRFVERKLDDRDKVMLVSFSHTIRTLWPTSDRNAIEQAILSMRARGATSLHDAMILALLQIPSSGSRRALVVFSDGQDTTSTYSSYDVEAVARRSGVPIYVLSLEPPRPIEPSRMGRSAVLTPTAWEKVDKAQRALEQLSAKTGGRAFDLESLDQLESIWAAIGEDLRKQSLVIYQTSPKGTEWRTLALSRKAGGKLRAPAGVVVVSKSPIGKEAS